MFSLLSLKRGSSGCVQLWSEVSLAITRGKERAKQKGKTIPIYALSSINKPAPPDRPLSSWLVLVYLRLHENRPAPRHADLTPSHYLDNLDPNIKGRRAIVRKGSCCCKVSPHHPEDSAKISFLLLDDFADLTYAFIQRISFCC